MRAALIHYRVASSAYDPERHTLLESALEVVGAEDSQARARLLTELAQQLTFADGPRGVAVGDEARAIARRLGDQGLLVEVITNRYGLIWDVDNLDLAHEGIALSRALDDPVGMALASWHLFHDSTVRGDRSGAEEGVSLLASSVARVTRPDLRWILTYGRADWACMNGDLDEAERLTDEAWQLALETGQHGALLVRAAQTMMIAWHRGRPGDAATVLAEAAQADPDFTLFRFDTGSGSGRADLGRMIEELPVDGAWLAAVAILAEQVARSGDRALMGSAYERLRPYRQLFNKQGPLVRGPVAHTLAVLAAAAGLAEQADADFGAADEVNKRLGFPFYTARTAVEWARFLIGAPGGRGRARALLETALATAVQNGYAGVERRARRLLAEFAA